MGAERKIVQNAVLRGKRHDNKILKLQILLSRNFVVIAQAPKFFGIFKSGGGLASIGVLEAANTPKIVRSGVGACSPLRLHYPGIQSDFRQTFWRKAD